MAYLLLSTSPVMNGIAHIILKDTEQNKFTEACRMQNVQSMRPPTQVSDFEILNSLRAEEILQFVDISDGDTDKME